MKQNLKLAVNLTALVLAAWLLIGLLMGCPNGSGPNRPNESAQPNGPVQPTDPSIFKTDGHGVITGYTCTKDKLPANLVIPAKIGDEVITGIGWWAFSGCKGLTSISLPENLTSIGGGAFGGCTDLTDLTVDSSNNKYKAIDNIIYTKDGLTLIAVPGSLRVINIPDTITEIYNGAFSSCTSLTEVKLPASLTTIGTYVFSGCTGLTSIDLSSCTRLTTIGIGAFYYCKGLTSLDLSSCTRLTTIGTYVFSGWTGLTEVKLPASLNEIKWFAFADCTGLTSAVFAETSGWAVYDDYENKVADIQQSDLADASKAAKYLRETYAYRYWKKN